MANSFLQRSFASGDLGRCFVPAVVPARIVKAVSCNKRGADKEPEYGTSVVASSCACGSLVLVKSFPKLGSGSSSDGMCANPHNTGTVACVGAGFARFHEEIDAAFRPG